MQYFNDICISEQFYKDNFYIIISDILYHTNEESRYLNTSRFWRRLKVNDIGYLHNK